MRTIGHLMQNTGLSQGLSVTLNIDCGGNTIIIEGDDLW